MRFLFVSIFLMFFSLNSYATPLQCVVRLNLTPMIAKTIASSPNEKIMIGEIDSMRAYVTENENNFFSLNLFFGAYETQVFSEAFLRTSYDKISLSFWNRDVLIDVQCALEN